MSQQLSRKSGPAAKEKNRQPLFTIAVTRARLIAALVAGLIAVGWIFLLGMIAGQMYPDMLARQSATAQSTQTGQTEQNGVRAAAANPAGQPASTGNGVLRPEDLDYKDQASGSSRPGSGAGSGAASGSTVTAGANAASGAAGSATSGTLGSAQPAGLASGSLGSAPSTQGGTSTSAPTGQSTGQAATQTAQAAQSTGQTAGQTSGQTAGQNSAANTSQAAVSNQRFNYVYQVASFKEAAQAQSLVDRLAGEGVKGSISEGEAGGSTWYRVLAEFQGTETDTRDLKAILGKFGITQVILRSKTPVGQ